MAEKTLKSRIIHKHDTAANWLKSANFIPKQGEIIVYDIDADHTYERFKIGDGKTAVNALPFADVALKDYVDTELAELAEDVNALDSLVGDKSVASQISTAIANKADASHTHDDRYYTESEMNTKLSAKADKNHTHDISGSSVSHATTADTAKAVAWANVTGKPSTYTPATHSHETSDITGLEVTLNGKVPTSRKINGKVLSSDITLSASDVGADASGAANTALTNAKSYTDTRISAMVGDETVSAQIDNAIDAAIEYVDGEIVDPVFYVTFTKQSNGTYTADQTYADVSAAYAADQTVMGLLNLGTGTIYHIPVLYCDTDYGIAFHTSLESSEPITIGYGKDGTIVSNVYDKLASKTDISDAISKITHPVTSVNGQTGAVKLTASSVGADVAGSASTALTNAKSYTDTRISAMVGDTAVSTQISDAVSKKADASHTHDDRYYTESEIDTKLSGKSDTSHTHSVYANQNAFSNVKVGNTTVAADSTTDTLTLAGSNVTITPDTTNDKVTIGITKDNVVAALGYTPPTTDTKVTVDTALSSTSTNPVQNKVVNAAISNLNTLVGDTAVATQISTAVATKADTNHAHDDRYYTETEMDSKLNGKLPLSGGTLTGSLTLDNSATSQSGEPHIQWATVGGNKPYTGFAHDQSDGTFIICSMEKDTTTNGVKYYKNGLAIGGGSGNLFWKGSKVITAADQSEATTSVAGLMSAADKTKLNGIATGATKVTVDSSLSSTSTNPVQNKIVQAAISNLNTLVGDTAVATQISNAVSTKADTGHTHKYAGSSSAGGAATSANKLNTNDGSATQPVYFANGVPVATTYTLGASVPSDAKFTDTVYTHPTSAGNKHIPSGGSSGQILKWSAAGTATWGAEKTYSNATTSAAGLMSAADKTTLNNLSTLVGDTAVATQISTAVATKADSNHTHSTYVNQNAFSNVKVGSTTVAADSTTDTLTLEGSNVTLTPDATNDKVTIGITKDNVVAALGYTPPTTNTTYSAAGSSLGLVKSGGDVTISSGVITVNDDSHNHTISNVDGLQTALNNLNTLVGDTAVSTQISNAISNHQHVIADISNIVISATEPSSPTTGMLWFDIS